MKKQLDTTAVINELKGASVFFPYKEEQKKITTKPIDRSSKDELARVTISKSLPPPKQTSPLSSEHDDLVEQVRKAIKEQGKEVSYVRLSQPEKNRLADIIYSYKCQGIKTTETEIGRIAINYLIQDYRASGKASILARMLASLHA